MKLTCRKTITIRPKVCPCRSVVVISPAFIARVNVEHRKGPTPSDLHRRPMPKNQIIPEPRSPWRICVFATVPTPMAL